MSTTTSTKTKVDASSKKKDKAPASAGVTNLGPSFDPFSQNDPFAGEDLGSSGNDKDVGKTDNKIHIRLQQRNGRKTLTTVQGLPDKYDPKKLLKAMKKEFGCNGHVVASAEDSDDESSPAPAANNKAPDFGRVLQFQGDQRIKTKEWLVAAGVFTEKEAKDLIVIHGY